MKWFDIKNRNYWRVSGSKEYTIQEVSTLTGITVRSLRNYLKTYEELLNPKRGYYNSLIFSEADISTFVMIKTLIKDGFKQNEVFEKVQHELSLLESEASVSQSDADAEQHQGVKEEQNIHAETDQTPEMTTKPLAESESKAVQEVPRQIPIPKKEPRQVEAYAIPDEEGIVRLTPQLVKNMNDYFMNLEKRNAMLENKLDSIEETLKNMNRPRESAFEKSVSVLIDSTQAFWSALKKSIP